MFFIVVILLLTILYTFLLSLIPVSNWFIFLWVFVAFILALISMFIFIILFILFNPKDKPNGKFRHMLLRNATPFSLWFLHIKKEVEGLENIPVNSNYVIYANHKSMMDPVIIYDTLHVICTAIGKKEIFQNFLMKKIGETYGAIALDRENDREALKGILKAIKMVKDGMPIIIFPEGGIKTRDTEEMVSLKAGAYKVALKAQAKILPVSVLGSSDISKKKRREKKRIKIIVHKPIDYEDFKNLNTTEIGTMVEKIINEDVRNA